MPLKTTITPAKIPDPYEDDRHHAFVLLIAVLFGLGAVAVVLQTYFH